MAGLLLQDAASASNLHVRSTITIYTRSELFNLRRVSDTSLPAPILSELKNSGILRYHGCRAGRRKIPTIISSDDIRIASTSLASLRTGVVRSNLISIPLRAPPEFVHRRQLCNFALVNARSIRNKTLILNDFIVEHDVDIFAITETWLRDSDFHDFFCSDICPAGYNFFHDPRTASHGGGVAVLTKTPFKVVKQQQLANFKNFEAYEAVLKSSGNYNLRLVNIYRPPPSTVNGLSVALFLEEFSTYLEHLKLAPGLLLMSGDFNFHVDRPNDSDSRRFMSILNSFDLNQHVVGATHRDGHTLDLIITQVSDDGLVSNCRVGDCISDHFAVHCDLQFKKPPLERKEITCRKIRSIDFTDFRYNLSNSCLVLDPADDLEALVRQYNVTLRSMLDTHAPLKTRTVTVRPYSPWFTEEIAIEKRKRRALERRWRSTGLNSDYRSFVFQCDVVNSLLRSAKTSYHRDVIESSNHDQRVLFETVDKLLHTKVEARYPSSSSDHTLANSFVNFFCEKIVSLRSSLDSLTDVRESTSVLMDPSPPVSCALSSFTVVTEEQLSSLVCSSKIKSCALDPVPAHVLKECLSVLLPALTKIVNLSIESALVPDCFKLALLNPLLKKPRLDFEIYANFRPISNLIFIAKLTEKVVASQLVDYVMRNDLDETFQSAYKQLHSTETALVRVDNDILVALDNHQSVILLLLGLSAAFDTVDHGILLDRLSHRFGICGLALSWFKSYLSNRFQFVEIRGEKSSHQPLTYGVPQGSVLGPILYLLYTSPLGDIVRRYNMGFHFYADDTQLYLSFDSLSGEGQASAVHSIEACASEIDEWMRLNKLKLNSDKSELLVISSKYRLRPSLDSISIREQVVNSSVSATNLGLIVDDSLSLEEHVNSISKSCYYHIRRIAKIRKYLSEDSTAALVHAFITCRLDNGNALLYGHPKYLI